MGIVDGEVRTMTRQGQCQGGFTNVPSSAVAFTYYEALYTTGDKARIYAEEARLRAFNSSLDQVGFPEHLYEDFALEAFQLLQEMAEAIERGDGNAKLLSAFNDEPLSMSIITYLKVGHRRLGLCDGITPCLLFFKWHRLTAV